jgi:hypothetical protein
MVQFARAAHTTGLAALSTSPDDVYVQYPTDNGVVSMAVYLPAPGVSAAALARKLRAKGLAAFIPGDRLHPLTNGCTYGTATALGGKCPPIHWNPGNFSNPQIYYFDESSSAWPVGTAITKWNSSPDIHVVWSPQGCPGTLGTHCIDVVDGNYGASGWTGYTWYQYNSSNHLLIDGSVFTHLNDYYALTSGEHRQVACHETGHGFGMGHNSSLNSCMYATTTTAVTNVPDGDDYLEITYNLYP